MQRCWAQPLDQALVIGATKPTEPTALHSFTAARVKRFMGTVKLARLQVARTSASGSGFPIWYLRLHHQMRLSTVSNLKRDDDVAGRTVTLRPGKFCRDPTIHQTSTLIESRPIEPDDCDSRLESA